MAITDFTTATDSDKDLFHHITPAGVKALIDGLRAGKNHVTQHPDAKAATVTVAIPVDQQTLDIFKGMHINYDYTRMQSVLHAIDPQALGGDVGIDGDKIQLKLYQHHNDGTIVPSPQAAVNRFFTILQNADPAKIAASVNATIDRDLQHNNFATRTDGVLSGLDAKKEAYDNMIDAKEDKLSACLSDYQYTAENGGHIPNFDAALAHCTPHPTPGHRHKGGHGRGSKS